MSNTKSRVSAFLERAAKLSTTEVSSPSSAKKVKKSNKPPIRKSNESQEKPRQSSAPTRRSVSPKLMDGEVVEELNHLVMMLIQKRQKLKNKVKKYQEEEAQVVNHMKNLLKKPSESSEEVFKRKSERILEVFRQEALSMDKKIYQLQEENKELKSRNSEYSNDGDTQLSILFNQFENTQDHHTKQALCNILTQKLKFEEEQRLETEQQATKMIAEEEKLIASLKEKIKSLEGKNLAETIELS